jgi:hypothetical protein
LQLMDLQWHVTITPSPELTEVSLLVLLILHLWTNV